jgi:hypothetical protein
VVAAGSAQDTLDGDARPAGGQRPSGPAAIRRRVLALVAIVLAVALLFVAYLQVSRTYPENSDESNTLLIAWDMLHGNVLLHGWSLSDVSFYTTELPQYVMLERFIGLHTGTAHVAAAMTYTLVVVFAGQHIRSPGLAADAADHRHHGRAPARSRRLRPAAVRRPHRHGRATHADLARA